MGEVLWLQGQNEQQEAKETKETTYVRIVARLFFFFKLSNQDLKVMKKWIFHYIIIFCAQNQIFSFIFW